MPERSFGRTIRYRRTKLGLSQAKLGELVGRSPATVRSWERDASTPNEATVIYALAAVLDLDARSLFDKAGVPVPERPLDTTVEQALASLAPVLPDTNAPVLSHQDVLAEEPSGEEDLSESGGEEPDSATDTSNPPMSARERIDTPAPAGVFPLAAPVAVVEHTYLEDPEQRQLYRIRAMATVVGVIGLLVMLIWGLGNAVEAVGDWWDSFMGTLRL